MALRQTSLCDQRLEAVEVELVVFDLQRVATPSGDEPSPSARRSWET
jgi:hypothetical protein